MSLNEFDIELFANSALLMKNCVETHARNMLNEKAGRPPETFIDSSEVEKELEFRECTRFDKPKNIPECQHSIMRSVGPEIFCIFCYKKI